MVRLGDGVFLPLAENNSVFHDLRGFLQRAEEKRLLVTYGQQSLDCLFTSDKCRSLLEQLPEEIDRLPDVDLSSPINYRPPLINGDLICVGRNYIEHVKELNNPIPKFPVLFIKPRSSLLAAGETILLPPESDQVEFEGELALVIGQDLFGENDPDIVERAIVGVTLLNDLTDRAKQSELKKEGKPWLIAKGQPTFAPLGPAIYLLNSIADLLPLELKTFHNGRLAQRGSPYDWIWKPVELVAIIAKMLGLKAGTILATGTPAGVGRLKNNDTISVECRQIGVLQNPVKERHYGSVR